ncbi:hypothetical protein Syn7502_00409 [Synechococcus sp. PCC 7502]|uniref:hypothetical protein n=1 Tax=Synechococcus sp. PCC 7502 TaxID=1173263 RepID=UPI00029FCA65|nr:hypothetical protein [Synechococcus sp. PCC 7502]AFY72572.1 hypothetical protein Syn7502_00409 [Synechococcus sp. PCC 7502]
MRLLGLIVTVGIVLYLVTSSLNKQTKPDAVNQNLLDKPAEVRTEVNKALDATEKARQDALKQADPKN